jgi:hypothetical protein
MPWLDLSPRFAVQTLDLDTNSVTHTLSGGPMYQGSRYDLEPTLVKYLLGALL